LYYDSANVHQLAQISVGNQIAVLPSYAWSLMLATMAAGSSFTLIVGIPTSQQQLESSVRQDAQA
jgi:hypothetical protein